MIWDEEDEESFPSVVRESYAGGAASESDSGQSISSSSTGREGSDYFLRNQPHVLPSSTEYRNPFLKVICILAKGIRDGLLMIPVLMVLMIVGLDFYVLIVVEMPRRYNREPTWCTVIVLTWIPIVFLLLISYMRTVCTSSAVIDNPPPSYLNIGPCIRCRKCCSLKPLRTHHCSICNKCMLKMDHHCPWVGNCVGFQNYKFFCLFILYADIGCILFLVGIWRSLLTIFSAGGVLEAPTLFAAILSGIFAFTLIFFGGFHFSMIVKNTTTLEVGDKIEFSAGSMYRNWITVFGPNPLLWFLPVQTIEAHKGWGWTRNTQEERERYYLI